MKKFKTILITLLTFAAVGGAFLYFYLNRTVDTIAPTFERQSIENAIISNEAVNMGAEGPQEIMDYGPIIGGSYQDDIVFVSKGFCSGDCPNDSIIVSYLMYFRESTAERCASQWGTDLNLVADGKRYCLFHIPEASCEMVGGTPFYDAAVTSYQGCATHEYYSN